MDSFVLKIRHVGVLRRLTLPPGDELNFPYARLESRARELFGLPAAASVSFTYVDSDGDVIALADDQDLDDALVLQALNPLRITMTGGASTDDSRISKEILEHGEKEDSATALEEWIEEPPPGDLASAGQDVSSSSLIDSKQSEVIPVVVEQSDISDFLTSEQPDSVMASEQSEAVGSEAREEPLEFVVVPEQNDRNVPSLAQDQSEVSVVSDKNMSRDDGAPSSQPSSQALADSRPDDGATVDAVPSEGLPSSPSLTGEIDTDEGLNVNADSDVASEDDATGKSAGDGKSEVKGEYKEDNNVHRGIQCDGCGMIPITGPRFKSCKKSNYDLCLGCYDARDEAEQVHYVEINRRFYRLVHPTFDVKSLVSAFGLKNVGEENSSNESRPVLHHGVQCDECGVTPIEGPRFKSSKRFNYDLCRTCYERSGSNDKEYYRLDSPTANRGMLPVSPIVCKIVQLAGPCHKLASLCGRWVWMMNPWTLVLDHTSDREDTPLMAGLNPGSKSTEDVEGNDEVGDAVTSSSDTPTLGAETQASDVHNEGDSESASEFTFTAEELAEVEAPREAPTTAESNGQDETKDVEGSDSSSPVKSDSFQEAAPEAESVCDMKENYFKEPAFDAVPAQAPGLLTARGEVATPVTSDAVASDEFSGSGSWHSAHSGMGNDASGAKLETPATEEDLSPLHKLMAKLEAMGFTDEALNKVLLEKHNMNLRRTLDDLCAAEEWDPMVEDLQEMGFYDENLRRT